LLDTNNTTKYLVQEYKEKNDTLTGLLTEYEGYKEKVKEVENALKQEQEAREKVEKTNKDLIEEIEKLNSNTEKNYKKLKIV